MYLYDGSQALDVRLLCFQQEPHDMMSHLLLEEEGREGERGGGEREGGIIHDSSLQTMAEQLCWEVCWQTRVTLCFTRPSLQPMGHKVTPGHAPHKYWISTHSINIITMTANTCSHAH